MSTLAILKLEFEKMNYRKDRSHPVFFIKDKIFFETFLR